MTTSQKMSLSKQLRFDEPFSDHTKAYFRERLRNRIYNLVAETFNNEKSSKNLSKADIARRLGISPALVNRWLGAPGNWTLDTISDLLLAISASELEMSASPIKLATKRNRTGPEWLNTTNQSPTETDVGTTVSQVVASPSAFVWPASVPTSVSIEAPHVLYNQLEVAS